MNRDAPATEPATPDAAAAAADPLLAPDEPPAFEVLNPEGSASALLVCDHASNRIPRQLGSLGLGADQLADHIAWDPGAAEVARGLAARLDAPLVLSGYSRLVIDPNRPLASPESIPERSDGIPIPGNLGLSGQARAGRAAALYDPYHQAIARLLAGRTGRPTLLLSIHSFTPVFGGEQRPWPVGVACWRDRRLAGAMLHALRRPGDLLVGDNQPYGVDDEHDYTLPTHGEGRGIPYVMIEIRQDLVRTPADISAWVARLTDAWEHLRRNAASLFADL
jgi:predicted N-formylglutamate amidohydrolase